MRAEQNNQHPLRGSERQSVGIVWSDNTPLRLSFRLQTNKQVDARSVELFFELVELPLLHVTANFADSKAPTQVDHVLVGATQLACMGCRSICHCKFVLCRQWTAMVG